MFILTQRAPVLHAAPGLGASPQGRDKLGPCASCHAPEASSAPLLLAPGTIPSLALQVRVRLVWKTKVAHNRESTSCLINTTAASVRPSIGAGSAPSRGRFPGRVGRPATLNQ